MDGFGCAATCGEFCDTEVSEPISFADRLLSRFNIDLPLMEEFAEERDATLPLPIRNSLFSTVMQRTVAVSEIYVGFADTNQQQLNRVSVGEFSPMACNRIFWETSGIFSSVVCGRSMNACT